MPYDASKDKIKIVYLIYHKEKRLLELLHQEEDKLFKYFELKDGVFYEIDYKTFMKLFNLDNEKM